MEHNFDWKRRAPPSAAPRLPGLFPLPSIPAPPPGGGLSKDARRRSFRRGRVWAEAVAAVDALNFLYGCSTADQGPPSVEPSPAQASVHARVLRAIAAGMPQRVQPGPEALRELLGLQADYTAGDGATVRPYISEKVSLPENCNGSAIERSVQSRKNINYELYPREMFQEITELSLIHQNYSLDVVWCMRIM